MAALHCTGQPRQRRGTRSRTIGRGFLLAAVVATVVLMSHAAPAVDATKAVPDGQRCYLDRNRNHLRPYCAGSMWNCVVVATPNPAIQVYSGICNSSYTKGSYCMYQSIAYAVGTKKIKGNSLCVTCDCKLFPRLKGDPNKAGCTCSPLPPCYVDYDGKAVGRFKCPSPQDMCVVTMPGAGGRDSRGLPIDEGECIYSGIGPICTSVGKGWGPKFYMGGTTGVPLSNDRCTHCTCGKNGLIPSTCRRVPGCTRK